MSLYNEVNTSVVTNTKEFDRSYKITILNPDGGVPSITFEEERIRRTTEGDGPTMSMSLGRTGKIDKAFTGALTFDLLNPETGETLGGQGTDTELAVLLYSLYIHLATERDS